jgi:glycosyltransferase involved in cell wall biosynthesis
MNALFIGPYRQNDGWGAATRDYIRSIATQTKNLSIRPIYLANNLIEKLDDDLLSYENSIYKTYDVVFQKTLPHCLVPQNITTKNVGIFTLETNNISHSNSIHLINRMSEICVPSNQEAHSLKISGIKIPIRVISQSLNTEAIKNHISNNTQKPFPFDIITSRSFKFYTIGEYIERKNLLDIVLAFNLAFDINDNVSLVIKTNKPGLNHQQSYQSIMQDIADLKRKMNIGSVNNKEVVITHRLSDNDMMSLHDSCDCFVSASKGEAFCRPAAEALCFGNVPMVTDHTGMIDFINNQNGFIINSHKTPVVTSERTLSNDFDIYNAHEYWYQPNIYSMIETMKKAYHMYRKDQDAWQAKRQAGILSIEKFSYSQIGQNICI